MSISRLKEMIAVNKQRNKMEKKIKLPQVTLCAMTSVNVYETVQALKYSMREIELEMLFWYRIKSLFICQRISDSAILQNSTVSINSITKWSMNLKTT